MPRESVINNYNNCIILDGDVAQKLPAIQQQHIQGNGPITAQQVGEGSPSCAQAVVGPGARAQQTIGGDGEKPWMRILLGLIAVAGVVGGLLAIPQVQAWVGTWFE